MTNKRKNKLKFEAAAAVTSLGENLSLSLGDDDATEEEIDYALKILSSLVTDRIHNKAVKIVQQSYAKMDTTKS